MMKVHSRQQIKVFTSVAQLPHYADLTAYLTITICRHFYLALLGLQSSLFITNAEKKSSAVAQTAVHKSNFRFRVGIPVFNTLFLSNV